MFSNLSKNKTQTAVTNMKKQHMLQYVVTYETPSL